jgi:hypothetical protein
MTRILV